MRRFGAFALCLLAWLAVPSGAGATALHDLTPQGCFSNQVPPSGCTTLPGQLNAARSVAVSGTSVYAAAASSGTVVSFTRAANGALTPQGCFSNAAVTGCTTLPGQLSGASSVAVSPDGASVYVASSTSDTLVSFTRAANGTLTPQGCFSNAALAGCSTLSDRLDGATAVAVSPTGDTVYAASFTSDTVLSFTRDANGALTPQGCFSNATLTGCAELTGQLDRASSVAVSRDGASVYATAQDSGTILSFTHAGNGALTLQGCFSSGVLPGCTELTGQLLGASSVTVSRDGASVYVGGGEAGTLVSFTRAANGALTPQECFSNLILGTCVVLADRLDDVTSVAVSADGSSVYAAVVDSSTLMSFTRSAANGALTPQGCFSNATLAGCTTLSEQLLAASSVAVSPDGAGVYATSSLGDAVLTFARELAPVCLGTTSSGPVDTPQTLELDCRDPNGDPMTISVVRAPQHGTLGAIDQGARTVTYTPNAAFVGADDLAIAASSDGKDSIPAIVAITVAPAPGTGPPGPAGPPGVSQLVALFSVSKATVRRGKPLRLSFVATAAGTAELAVTKKSKTLATVTRSLAAAGRGKLTIKGRRTRTLKPGRYALELTFTAPGADRPATDTIRLRVKR